MSIIYTFSYFVHNTHYFMRHGRSGKGEENDTHQWACCSGMRWVVSHFQSVLTFIPLEVSINKRDLSTGFWTEADSVGIEQDLAPGRGLWHRLGRTGAKTAKVFRSVTFFTREPNCWPKSKFQCSGEKGQVAEKSEEED